MPEGLLDPLQYTYNALSLQSAGVALAALCIGFFALGRERDRRVTYSFFVLSVLVGWWLFCFAMMYAAASEVMAFWWAKAAYIGVALIPAADYQLASHILGDYERERLRTIVFWLISAVFLVLILSTDMLFESLYRYPWGYYPEYASSSIPFLAYFFIVISAGLYRLARGFDLLKDSGANRENAWLTTCAFGIGATAAVDFLPAFGIALYPIGYIPISLFILMAAYLMARHGFSSAVPEVVAAQIIDTMNDALIVTDRNGTLLKINDATVRLMGGGGEALVGNRLADCSALGAVFELYAAVSAAGALIARQLELRRPEGTVCVNAVATVIRDQSARPMFYVFLMHDVTEQRHAEDELFRINEKLRQQLRFTETLLNAEPIGVFFKDAQGRYLGCNAAFSAGAGVTPETIIGKTVFEVWPSELAEVYHHQDMALIRNPHHQVYESKIINADGRLTDVVFHKDVFYDEKGEVAGVIGTFLDITERKQAEDKIKKMNTELDLRVKERTAELETANKRLREEIQERRKAEDALREKSEHIRAFSSRLLAARESERRHIAGELHDETGQRLTAIKLSLEGIRHHSSRDVAMHISDIQQEIGNLMIQLRDLSASLRPSIIEDLGLLPALQWHIEKYTDKTGVAVDFRHAGIDRPFPKDVALIIFRTVQEALTNVARHSGVMSARITITAYEEAVLITITDDGAGFDPGQAIEAGKTLGLMGMRERIEEVGGDFAIRSCRGAGAEISCRIPLDMESVAGA